MTVDKKIFDIFKNNSNQLDLDFDFTNMQTVGYGAQPALTISSIGEDTITLGDNTFTGATGSGAAGHYNYGSGTYDYNNITWGGGSSVPTITIAPNTSTPVGVPGTIITTGIGSLNWSEPKQSSLQVNGDANFDGDVKIKGKSLVDMLEKIEEKLAILRPNEELEEKWDELRELRNRYKELEKEIIEKEKMWDILKK